MKITVYPIKSVLAYGDLIGNESKALLAGLKKKTGYDFEVVSLDKLGTGDLSLILVQSGGSENFFKKDIFPNYPGPYYLLTYGSSNSLAASLEILTFIRENSKRGEVLHGDEDYIVSRLKALLALGKKKESGLVRLGVLGAPSDWLISSDVDYRKARSLFGLELVDVKEEEVISEIEKRKDSLPEGEFASAFNKVELVKAYRVYRALKSICRKYGLDGLTISCFDIIKACQMSACLALSLLNKEGIIASCEGDIPAMITAYEVQKVLGLHCFQANPNWIDPTKNELTLAHCTLPLDMAESYTFDTHFESGIGVGIHGEMRLGPVTIVKISADLKEFYLEEGEIKENQYRKDRCRTQIVVSMDAPVTYFLTSSLGNHHQVFYGRHKEELKKAFLECGLREVEG